MLLRDISFSLPEENILFDDVLLHLAQAKTQKEALRLWESPAYFVVLGRIGKEDEDVYAEAAKRDRIPVLRRSSGGGTVVQGKGCLNYSLILSKSLNPAIGDLRKSYQFILGKVIHALETLGIDAEFHPISDIALKGTHKKISGNAQKRSRDFILHHGTLLYDFDLSMVGKYLAMPNDAPVYRKGRPHSEFIANAPVASARFKKALCKEFDITDELNRPNSAEKNCLNRFLNAKKSA